MTPITYLGSQARYAHLWWRTTSVLECQGYRSRSSWASRLLGLDTKHKYPSVFSRVELRTVSCIKTEIGVCEANLSFWQVQFPLLSGRAIAIETKRPWSVVLDKSEFHIHVNLRSVLVVISHYIETLVTRNVWMQFSPKDSRNENEGWQVRELHVEWYCVAVFRGRNVAASESWNPRLFVPPLEPHSARNKHIILILTELLPTPGCTARNAHKYCYGGGRRVEHRAGSTARSFLNLTALNLSRKTVTGKSYHNSTSSTIELCLVNTKYQIQFYVLGP